MEDRAVLFNFDAFLADPKGLILVFLLALPGRLLAISAHEMGHAWVAYKCGDLECYHKSTVAKLTKR